MKSPISLLVLLAATGGFAGSPEAIQRVTLDERVVVTADGKTPGQFQLAHTEACRNVRLPCIFPSMLDNKIAAHRADLAEGCHGALLFNLAAKLSPRFAHERSFAVRSGELRTNRFVLSLSVAEIPGGVRERILDACGQMKMPSAQIETVGRHLSTTRFLHLGFEGGNEERLYKIYLEQETPVSPATGKPILQHLAFKWDELNPSRHMLTRYTWYPTLSVAAIHERISGICSTEARAIARQLIDSVVGPVAKWDLRYLEAEEAGNSRRSFDLNLYDAGMRLAEIKPSLMRMWEHYRIESAKWQPVLASDWDETLGHLSGGVHRNGEDFFNVYYGRKSIRSRQGDVFEISSA